MLSTLITWALAVTILVLGAMLLKQYDKVRFLNEERINLLDQWQRESRNADWHITDLDNQVTVLTADRDSRFDQYAEQVRFNTALRADLDGAVQRARTAATERDAWHTRYVELNQACHDLADQLEKDALDLMSDLPIEYIPVDQFLAQGLN